MSNVSLFTIQYDIHYKGGVHADQFYNLTTAGNFIASCSERSGALHISNFKLGSALAHIRDAELDYKNIRIRRVH